FRKRRTCLHRLLGGAMPPIGLTFAVTIGTMPLLIQLALIAFLGKTLFLHGRKLFGTDKTISIPIHPAMHPLSPFTLQTFMQLIDAQPAITIGIHTLETFGLTLLHALNALLAELGISRPRLTVAT